MARLRLSDVTVVLENHPCLASVSLSLETGDIACVHGRSGAGKSTLLRTIAGEQSGLISGSVCVEGAERSDRSLFGWVPQDRSLWSHMTLLENVVFVGRNICRYPRDEA
jgi:ABC-type multidrug transport system ATPase subunit